jgi:hypothetical protein
MAENGFSPRIPNPNPSLAVSEDHSVCASSSSPTCQVARNATLAQSSKRERRVSPPSQSFVPILVYRIGWL